MQSKLTEAAAVKIQAVFRGNRSRQLFYSLQRLRACVLIQSEVRKWLAYRH